MYILKICNLLFYYVIYKSNLKLQIFNIFILNAKLVFWNLILFYSTSEILPSWKVHYRKWKVHKYCIILMKTYIFSLASMIKWNKGIQFSEWIFTSYCLLQIFIVNYILILIHFFFILSILESFNRKVNKGN